jgi:hypothetical protein
MNAIDRNEGIDMEIRRVVAGLDADGRSVIVSDGFAPHSHDFTALPGQSQTRIWFTAQAPPALVPDGEPTTPDGPVLPEAGGASFVIVQFAPDACAADPGFDPVAAGNEFAACAPDIAAATEIDNPGMHRTPTVDYGVVLDGEIWLEVDDGVQVRLTRGDTVVQLAGRHAWRNKAAEPALVAFVLTGAAR